MTPTVHVDDKHSRIKQYHKEGRALRTETTIDDSRDFGIGKRLHNLPALRQVGFQANRRLTYQLRRLRLHGLIARQAGTHRYGVTEVGLRVALFFTRSYARVLRPGLAEVIPEEAGEGTPLRRAFVALERAMDQYVAQAKLTQET